MKWITMFALCLAASACASSVPEEQPSESTTTIAAPRTVVVTITEDGGCFMMGPNCASYVAYSDGSVELRRTREPGEAEAVTLVEPGLITRIQDLLTSTDLDALRADLPEGECKACFDGTDTTFIYETAAGQVRFAGTEVELVEDEPLFATTWQVRNLAAQDTDLGMQVWPQG